MSQLKKLKREQTYNPDRFNTKFLQEDATKAEKAGKIKKIPAEYNTLQERTSYQEIKSESRQQTNSEESNQEINSEESNQEKYSEEAYNLQQSNIYMDDLGINMKNLFFNILEMLVNKENPIPYIMENDRRQFTFAVMILLVGGLMLFFSNLMINEKS